jgi:hypothetical protein
MTVDYSLEHPDILDLEDGLQPPAVEDEIGAARALRNIAFRQAQITRINEIEKAETAKIKEWGDRKRAALERDVTFFSGTAEEYMRRINEASGGKIKSMSTPAGKLQLYTVKGKLIIEDEDTFITTYSGKSFIVEETTAKIVRAELKTFIKENDGEIPEGVTFADDELRFRVKVEV